MKTRTVTRYRREPHTVDGITEHIDVPYEVDLPQPPRDWDQLVRTGVTIGAVVLVTVSVVWSTASIGELLARVTVAAAAYGAAVAFDTAWIMCMAVEWLHRYDPPRAAKARTAGHWALAVAMGAVGAHGYITSAWVIGVVGALVSALAKGAWTIAMSVHARPLDARTQQWVAKRRAALDGQRAMIPVRRDLMRSEALIAAERAALGPSPDADPDQSGHDVADPDAETDPPDGPPMTVKDAVRTALDSGIADPERVLAYVRKRADANAKPATVERYIRLARLAG
ncbi:protein transporter Sec31 [Streptomyces sp. PKU-MA01144]|uniref:protein transporter Sec31 n=1 Tax=Streptomyces sp. PKU-MA01144 TaxID=2729138 RepID=UPI00147C8CAF|nr:protein transporter Sec31 [Streptomyces sp. PKU-MA01144]NNJ04165.1 protein transporter Sec31 [Streptomyces sp. PKU-MA01144]